MNIKELIYELENAISGCYHNTISLLELATPVGKARDNVRSLSHQIFRHLVKIVLYGIEEETTLHHWCHELNNWLEQCMVVKIKRKRPRITEQELFSWLIDYYTEWDDISDMQRSIEKQYTYQGHKKRNISTEQVYQACINILKEVCPIVANRDNDDFIIEEVVRKHRLG